MFKCTFGTLLSLLFLRRLWKAVPLFLFEVELTTLGSDSFKLLRFIREAISQYVYESPIENGIANFLLLRERERERERSNTELALFVVALGLIIPLSKRAMI